MAKSKREVLIRGHNWMRQKHQRPGDYDEEGRCVGPGGVFLWATGLVRGPPNVPVINKTASLLLQRTSPRRLSREVP